MPQGRAAQPASSAAKRAASSATPMCPHGLAAQIEALRRPGKGREPESAPGGSCVGFAPAVQLAADVDGAASEAARMASWLEWPLYG